jgi:DNA helicase-2/ATP-dependent DNA helicase PcrA
MGGRGPLERHFTDDLNPVQRDAVRHEGGPLLVLAGAGSGKTRVLTYRVAYLVRELGVSPRRIMAVTFTNKAAGEMRRRVEELIGGDVGLAWIGTFHSMCARMLRVEASWGWWTPGYSIYDDADQLDLVKESMKKVGLAASTFAPRAVLSTISRAKDRLLTAQDYERDEATDYFKECVAKVYAEYERGLVENNALDFDDLIMKAVWLLREHRPVLDAYAGRFEHLLVDEYQDTSHAQYTLVNLLSSAHRNIMVVGDDDQSIYGWRGADITNILDFEHDHPDATVLRLEQNYRSTKRILAAAHDVVSRNERRKDKELWTEREEGCLPHLSRVSNEYQEADAIRDRIVERMSARGIAYGDFAILYRTHAQSRVIEDALRRAGIAYDIVGGVRFYERAEVKDVLAYLRVVANPQDAVSLRRIINTPPRKVGDKSVERLEAFAADAGLTILEAAGRADEVDGLPAAARESLGKLASMFRSLIAKVESAPVDALIDEVLRESGYSAWLEGQGTEQSRERLLNVEELVSAASEFVEWSEEHSLTAFLEQVSLVADIDLWEDASNAVSLMTLHNAKGLEFAVVMIPGVEEGLLPHESSFDDDEELEEERRLFYVGMTRAKDELYLYAADTRRRAGVLDVRAKSRFLSEISPSNLETESLAAPLPRGVRIGRPSGRGRPKRESVFPDYEGYSQEGAFLEPGARVRHPRWGEGEVLDVSGEGLDAIVRVRFADGAEKRIMLRYAKLELMTD